MLHYVFRKEYASHANSKQTEGIIFSPNWISILIRMFNLWLLVESKKDWQHFNSEKSFIYFGMQSWIYRNTATHSVQKHIAVQFKSGMQNNKANSGGCSIFTNQFFLLHSPEFKLNDGILLGKSEKNEANRSWWESRVKHLNLCD